MSYQIDWIICGSYWLEIGSLVKGCCISENFEVARQKMKVINQENKDEGSSWYKRLNYGPKRVDVSRAMDILYSNDELTDEAIEEFYSLAVTIGNEMINIVIKDLSPKPKDPMRHWR